MTKKEKVSTDNIKITEEEWQILTDSEYVASKTFLAYVHFIDRDVTEVRMETFPRLWDEVMYSVVIEQIDSSVVGLDLEQLDFYERLNKYLVEGRVFRNDYEVVVPRDIFWFGRQRIEVGIGDRIIIDTGGFYKELTVVGLLADQAQRESLSSAMFTSYSTAKAFADTKAGAGRTIQVSDDIELLGGHNGLLHLHNRRDFWEFRDLMLEEHGIAIWLAFPATWDNIDRSGFDWLRWSLNAAAALSAFVIVVSVVFAIKFIKNLRSIK